MADYLSPLYNYQIQSNASEFNDGIWGSVLSTALPYLATQVGQKIAIRQNPKRINKIAQTSDYQKLVDNTAKLNSFKENAGYGTGSLITKKDAIGVNGANENLVNESQYTLAREKLLSQLSNKEITGNQYFSELDKLNQSTVNDVSTSLNKSYNSITNKYQNAYGFNDAFNTRFQSDVTASLNSAPVSTVKFNPATPQNNISQNSVNTIPYSTDTSRTFSNYTIDTNLSANITPEWEKGFKINSETHRMATETLQSSDLQTPTATKKPMFDFSNWKGAVGGAAGSILASTGVNALGNAVGLNNSKGGQMISGTLAQVAGNVGSTVGSNLVTGQSAFSNLGSSLGSASAIGQGGMALANIALDVFDPVKKSKAENIANMGLGAAGLAAAIAGAGGPVGWAIGGLMLAGNLAGHLGGKRTQRFTADRDLLAQTDGSYGGSINKISEAEALANKKHSMYDMGGLNKDNRKIYEANNQQTILDRIISNRNDLRNIVQGGSSIAQNRQEYNENGGYNQLYAKVGKHGLKFSEQLIGELPTLKVYGELPKLKLGGELPSLKLIGELPTLKEIAQFKNGGSINIIPEGKLHAHKHNMDIDGITTKGIPVVSDGDNGEVVQQAEIERQEIIFRKSVTEELERLEKIYYSYESSNKEKEEAALEAGKLLVYEILENTQDNTNLINEIQ